MTARERNPGKVLFLTRSYPFPARGGAALRDAGLIRELAAICPVEIITLLSPGEPRPVTANQIPAHFVTREKPAVWRRALNPFLPYVVNGFSPRLAQFLAAAYEPNASLWVSRLALGQYVGVARRIGYRVILDEHNVESEYYWSAVRRSRRWAELPLAAQLSYWEKRFCQAADEVVVTSRLDEESLVRLCGPLPIRVIPNCVDVSSAVPSPVSSPAALLFAGTLDYAPNLEGLEWFLGQVVPRLPGVKLRIAGARPTARLRTLAGEAGAEVHADVPDMRPLYASCEVCVAPILSGGGTRLKILEALAYGKAVVATGKAAEGLDLVPERHFLLADQPGDFARAIQRLLADPDLRARLAGDGRREVNARYTWRAQSAILGELIGPGTATRLSR